MIANAHRALTNALLKIATPAEIPESRERPWASVTFTGARHWVSLSVGPARAAEIAAMLRAAGFEPVWKDWDPSYDRPEAQLA